MTSMDDWLTREGGLANRLYRLRKVAGVSGRQIARDAGWGPPKVSKLENGRQLPTREDITTWARICGTPADVVDELLHLLDEALGMHSEFRQRMRLGLAQIQYDNEQLTRSASRIRDAATTTVPGLLQVPEYARARVLEGVRMHGADAAEVETAVAARMARQHVLHDTTKRFEFVLTEAVLRMVVCEPAGFQAQLHRLLTFVDPGMPHVFLGVIPFATQLSVNPQHHFAIYDSLVAVETVTNEYFHEGDAAAATYATMMGDLVAESVTGAAAARLIRQAMSALPSTARR
jgi:transcriptional regulator with XRE-family HTH domain